jgi:general secretion pathway protein F
VLTRELATLLEAGLTLDRSLQILIDLNDEERVVRVLEALQERVRGGATFSTALEEQGAQFPRLYINMVRAGEASGALDGCSPAWRTTWSAPRSCARSVTSALVYPAILLFVAGALGDPAPGLRRAPVHRPVRRTWAPRCPCRPES